jgi:hypothetical protein
MPLPMRFSRQLSLFLSFFFFLIKITIKLLILCISFFYYYYFICSQEKIENSKFFLLLFYMFTKNKNKKFELISVIHIQLNYYYKHFLKLIWLCLIIRQFFLFFILFFGWLMISCQFPTFNQREIRFED